MIAATGSGLEQTMSDDDSGLPQAVIDDMFNRAAHQTNAAPTALADPEPERAPEPEPEPDPEPESRTRTRRPRRAKEPKTASTASAPPPGAASGEETIEMIRQTLADLTQRTAKLEVELQKLDQKRNEAAGVGAAILQLEEKLEAATRHVREVDGRVMTISRKLQDTPSYGARSEFSCESCGSSGLVAMPVKCTYCGKEGWWGWWPDQK